MTSTREHLDRRSFLAAVGAASVLVACGSEDATSVASSSDAGTPSAPGACLQPPAETSGPFPGDGSNDNGAGEIADVLADARAVRRDIRSNLDGTDTQDGVPLRLTMTVNDSTCAPLVGAAVYVWHCSRDGAYSMYASRMSSGDFTEATWLRGVQVTDSDGVVAFDSVLPGRYPGRATHIHFEVYADAEYGNLLLTSQLAFDDATLDGLYEAAGYASSISNTTYNAEDRQFSDGVDEQLLTIDGDVSTGLAASIIIAV